MDRDERNRVRAERYRDLSEKSAEKAKMLKNMQSKEYYIGDVKVVENYPENRMQLFFDGKPDQSVRDELKKNGFRWSGYNGCWQSYLNYSSRLFIKKMSEKYGA